MRSEVHAPALLRAVRHPRVLRDAIPRPVRFCMVGASGVVVNAAVLFAMHGPLHLPLTLAAVIATEAAIVSNYTANNVATFPGRRWSLARLARFNVASLIAAAIAVGILTLLAGAAHIHYLLADVIAIAIAAAINYMTSAWFVWTRVPVRLPSAATPVRRAL